MIASAGPIVPFDLKPRRLASAERMLEILDACKRNLAAGKRIPEEWLVEFRDLNEHVGERFLGAGS